MDADDRRRRQPSRYTVGEWFRHNTDQFVVTKDEGIRAEKLIEHSSRIQDRVRELISKKKCETEWLFRGRIKDIDFLRSELEEKRKSIQEELEALDVLQERIEDEVKCVRRNAGEIVDKCIQFRERRLGIDLIHDEVERELEVEKKKIKEAGDLLDKTLEQTKETKRDLRASLYLLNRDVRDKLTSLTIETECLNLKESDRNLRVHPGYDCFENANITVEEWTRYSQEIMAGSNKKIQNARLFASQVKILLEEIISDLSEQYYTVNEVFQRRIEDVKDAKLKLEGQHYEITGQINDMNLHIGQLIKSIQEKEGFLALAQTRLEKRLNRPGIELVKDRVELSLKSEVSEIKDSVTKLQQLLAQAEKTLRSLLETQVNLEKEINIKTNSIKIDEVDCLTIRQNINYQMF